MSKQEMRDEAKETMGNPQVKGRIRRIQNAMRRRKVKADMSRASVVVTNPTHYAVALEFSFEIDAGADSAGEGPQPACAADSRGGALGGRAHRREPAAGAVAVQVGRGGPADPVRAVCGGGRNSGVSLSAAGGEGRAGAQGSGRGGAVRRTAALGRCGEAGSDVQAANGADGPRPSATRWCCR